MGEAMSIHAMDRDIARIDDHVNKNAFRLQYLGTPVFACETEEKFGQALFEVMKAALQQSDCEVRKGRAFQNEGDPYLCVSAPGESAAFIQFESKLQFDKTMWEL